MFAQPLNKDFPGVAQLAGMYDVNPVRLAYANTKLSQPVPTYKSFSRMMRDANPDGVVVASRDCTHAEYIVAALKAGKRAISEKPLCTTAAQCRKILAAAAQGSGRCFVTHNMRYDASQVTIQEIIRSGRLGRILFMQFDETLDRCHGADYFRRWHCHMANSSGLLIHKASHHFDILNWWAGSKPAWVSAQGKLNFYGKNGPFNGPRCRGCPHASECEFYADMFKWPEYEKLYLSAESADGYLRDGCVFDPSIDIYDQMGVLIRYENDLQVSYTLTAYTPYESQRTIIEGTKGRLEYISRHNTGWVVDSHPLPGVEQIAKEEMKLYMPGIGIQDVKIERGAGSHGGADPQLRSEFFGRDWDAPSTEQMASLQEAVQAVLIGVAANKSIASGKPVAVQELLKRG